MILKKILIGATAGFIAKLLFLAMLNVYNGKTIIGKTRKYTVEDWKGNVHLGRNDFCIE